MRRLIEAALGALVGAGLVLVTGASATSTPHLQSDGWRVVGVVVEDGAGARYTLPLAGLTVPVPTATPPPTNTPRPAPTVAASATPSPTRTPTPAAMATPTQPPASPTPTQEVALPTPTATTTPRPPPDKGNCLVKLGGTAINERVAPRLSAARTATSPIPAGSIVVVTEFASAEGYLWARNAFGWFAVRQGASWWITFTADSLEWCLELPGYPAGVQPPQPIVHALPGVWAGPGANRDELLAFGAQIKAAGYQPAATVYGDGTTADVLLTHGWFVLRRAASVPDCPEMTLPPDASAASFMSRVVAETGTRAQVVVAANECIWPSAEWAAAWVAAAGRYAAALGVRALVPSVWHPGAPELEWVQTLAPAYRSAPIALLWGVNLYPVRADLPLAARGMLTQYTTFRYELYCQHLRGVSLVVTEYARGDGAQSPDFSDIRVWWRMVRDDFAVATAWYVAGDGGLGNWQAANLRGRLRELAGALQ